MFNLLPTCLTLETLTEPILWVSQLYLITKINESGLVDSAFPWNGEIFLNYSGVISKCFRRKCCRTKSLIFTEGIVSNAPNNPIKHVSELEEKYKSICLAKVDKSGKLVDTYQSIQVLFRWYKNPSVDGQSRWYADIVIPKHHSLTIGFNFN